MMLSNAQVLACVVVVVFGFLPAITAWAAFHIYFPAQFQAFRHICKKT